MNNKIHLIFYFVLAIVLFIVFDKVYSNLFNREEMSFGESILFFVVIAYFMFKYKGKNKKSNSEIDE